MARLGLFDFCRGLPVDFVLPVSCGKNNKDDCCGVCCAFQQPAAKPKHKEHAFIGREVRRISPQIQIRLGLLRDPLKVDWSFLC